MSIFSISFSYLTSRLQHTVLNIIMMAVGIMLITVLLLFGYQMQKRLIADSQGIDAVIGDKGSPLQLILSTIYHVDIPVGNIDLKIAKKIKKHPFIKRAIPIALGDSYKGYRIVGTDPAYIKHFKSSFAKGNIWHDSMQAVIGHEIAKNTDLQIGNNFFGSHGLLAGGEVHEEQPYKIIGILKPTGSVIDRLIITSLDSVWDIHNHHEDLEDHHDGHHHHKKKNTEEEKEITALLVQYKTKIASIAFPLYVNKNTNMQVASPSFEITRLLRLIGIGKNTIILFGSFLIILSLSSILIGLFNSVYQRRYDLAIFRTLGASRKKIFLIVIIEGMIISILASIIGLIAGHLAIELIGCYTLKGSELGLTGFIFLPQIFILWFLILLFCLIACSIPAVRAYKTDIKEMLTHVV